MWAKAWWWSWPPIRWKRSFAWWWWSPPPIPWWWWCPIRSFRSSWARPQRCRVRSSSTRSIMNCAGSCSSPPRGRSMDRPPSRKKRKRTWEDAWAQAWWSRPDSTTPHSAHLLTHNRNHRHPKCTRLFRCRVRSSCRNRPNTTWFRTVPRQKADREPTARKCGARSLFAI